MRRGQTSPRASRTKVRSRAALSLVEILVSLVVGSLLAFAMADLFAGVRRLSNTSQNEMYANLIAQELVENARGTPYSFLSQYAGQQFTLLVNRETAGQPTSALRDEPLQLDLTNLSWNDLTKSARFNGTVQYRIDSASDLPQGLILTYTISWADASHGDTASSGAGRSITSSVRLFRDGVAAWTP